MSPLTEIIIKTFLERLLTEPVPFSIKEDKISILFIGQDGQFTVVSKNNFMLTRTWYFSFF